MPWTEPPEEPPLDSGETTIILELAYDDFNAQSNITRDIEITNFSSLIVNLYSNPTTGFQWGEAPDINQPNVIEQVSHEFIQSPIPEGASGVGGTDVWVFILKETGIATINFSYSQPWEGGTQNMWTVTLNITVV
ncbi:MAG: protease inhibitor I42 family protein [Dehalococcoidales bacterium]|nr:protease inhibitor I42 family protein [Dehalococcoidales bacterium]